MRRALLAASAVLLAFTLGGCGTAEKPIVSGVSMAGNHGFNGAFIETPYVVPDIALLDTGHDRVSLARTGNRLELVFFGYTNCPDICQTVMSTMASAVVRLDKSERSQVQGVFVTTDPARDTESVLRTYLDRFDPAFMGLTGGLHDIAALGKPLGIFIEKGDKLPSGGYEVTHTTAVIAVQNGRGKLVWTQGTSPAQMSTDIQRLLKESS